MKSKYQGLAPHEIEVKSFEIIESELKEELDPQTAFITKRCIHTSADFEYAESLYFSAGVVEQALEALQSNATIITDTTMALSGINKHALNELGLKAECFIRDEEVARLAKERGTTRSREAVDKAIQIPEPLIFVVGNAPTALIRIYELIQENKVNPALVIGVPVGFVNVVESKEMMMQCAVPQIINRGRKGGSNIAAAIVNALMYKLTRK